MLSLALLVVASISSSLFDELSLSSNWAGVATWDLILRAMPKFVPAGEPRDMGLSEQELHPEPLATRFTRGSTTLFTRDPSAKFRRAFSLLVTCPNSWVGRPKRDMSKGGTETGPS